MFKILKKLKSKKSNYESQVREIIQEAQILETLSDKKLQSKTEEFKRRLKAGETLEDIKVEAFATVYESAKRVLGLTPHPVQVHGALILHNGDVAEMKTGEGKTLTSTMPIYLNALSGLGVHVVTVNDYLAKRDSSEMGKLFGWLGLSIGFNNAELKKVQKKLAYEQDITYSTHSELCFDYLRDNMVLELKDKVQRPLNYAIIDECDSILIDDARTPLIISGGKDKPSNLYKLADFFIKSLSAADYNIDIEYKTVSLSDSGCSKAEAGFQIENLFDVKHTLLVHHIQQALKANHIIVEGVDYIITNGKVSLVDQNTGRVLKGRAYSDGLQQAIQQKHNLEVTEETKTIATITYQNYFRLYTKLAGMTGTAKTEEEEFIDIYNMKVHVVPTNKPIIREDSNDLIFGNRETQFKAIINKIKEFAEINRPILIGTRSVETSEAISKTLNANKIKHVVLNAKNHEKESQIIENAGQKGAITIATNMAGRGTDIKLGPGVEEIGGLAVIGCERNESRRIDNQLIGRSGRQGQPGFSKFYISWEDELLVRFSGDKAKKQGAMLKNDSVESKLLTKVIEQAQKRVEGQNYDSRKSLVEYDDVIRLQRETIYKQRDAIIVSNNLYPTIELMFDHVAKIYCNKHAIYIDKEKQIDGVALCDELYSIDLMHNELDAEKISILKFDEALNYVKETLKLSIQDKVKEFGSETFAEAKKSILLSIIDNHWQNHIDTMTKLRSGIHLRSYSQKSPLQAYVQEGFNIFEDMKSNISLNIVYAINSLEINEK